MARKVTVTIHFMDKSKIVLEYPQQSGADPATIAANVGKALKADKVVAEVSGDLLIMPTQNIKYSHLHPAAPKLPAGVFRNASSSEHKAVRGLLGVALVFLAVPRDEAVHRRIFGSIEPGGGWKRGHER